MGSDLFEFKGTHYLLVVDYFSQYPEVVKLHPQSRHLKFVLLMLSKFMPVKALKVVELADVDYHNRYM